MKKFLFGLITVMLIAGCQVRELDNVAPLGSNPGDVTATIGTATKTALSDGNAVNWVSGDKISVFDGYNYQYGLKTGANTTEGTFGYEGWAGSYVATSAKYAVYPYSAANQVTSQGVLTVDFPAEFTTSDNVAKAVMVAKSTNYDFSFKNAQGLVRVNLSYADGVPPIFQKVKKVKVESDNSNLAGAATVTFDENGDPTATVTGSTKAVTVSFETPVTLSTEATSIIFPLAAGEYTDLDIIFTMTDGTNERDVEFDLPTFTQQRSKIYTLAHKFTMSDVEASTPSYGEVASTVEIAQEQLASKNSVEVAVMSVEETLQIPTAKADQEVNIKIDAVQGEGSITISAPTGANAPATVNVEAPAGASVVIDCADSHVTLNGTDYEQIIASTSGTTLVVPSDVTVDALIVKSGNVKIENGATVTTLSRHEDNTNTVTVYVENGATLTTVSGEGVERVDAVAVIGEESYYTLAEAIDAVANGGTVTMVQDVAKAAGISVPEGRTFTVDFAGHTYSTEKPGAGSASTQTQAFQLLKNSTITFKNGTINCTEDNKNFTWPNAEGIKGVALIIQNYANLTLEDMTIDAANIAHNGSNVRYAISNNCGTVEFKGATTIKAPVAGDYAFDVCKYNSYAAPTVTWNSTGTVEGFIELSGGEFIVAKDLALTKPIKAVAAATMTVNANITPAATWNGGDALVIVNRKGDLTIGGSGKVSNNGNEAVYAAIKITEKGEDNAANAAKLTVNGGTFEGEYYAIVGNGGRHNTDITINNGTFSGKNNDDNLAIFHPQNGTLTINNGTFTGESAIEMRAGTLVVNGGTFTATAASFSCIANGSGNTTKGAAIAVAEHSTNLGVNVTINGGSFTGVKAISIENPQALANPNMTVVVNGGTFSDMSGVNYVANNKTYTISENVTLSDKLIINSGNTFTIDLGGNTLTGRTNLTHGNVTFTNGTINGGNQQALNVYGSAEEVENYSVLTIASDVNVVADVYGVCLFGPTFTAKAGYGAVVNINGTVTTTGDGASGSVFVSGNLGNNLTTENKNIINITGSIQSGSDAALALNGGATVNISGDASLTGNTALSVKRGNLNITGGTFTANGAKNEPGTDNYNGTEMTGAALSVTNTYSQYGPISVVIDGGSFISGNGSAVFVEDAEYAGGCSVVINNGSFSDSTGLGYVSNGGTYSLN